MHIKWNTYIVKACSKAYINWVHGQIIDQQFTSDNEKTKFFLENENSFDFCIDLSPDFHIVIGKLNR